MPSDDTEHSGSLRRGELRIYLGSAPGVGKTFAMLGEGKRRAARGTDVVVGLVETHGRDKTAALLDGMEVIPRRTVIHRGVELSDLDVDAILARNPEVVLVDELAHNNAPGSRNTKRWKDIDEFLEAGITVLSTVNVQHLESMNDVVERITGVAQRETVPDSVVRRAEQIELVDITPEALRRRMAHGNIYPSDRVDAALSNYFRPGNLTALRELALLWLADQVDVALQRYRTEQDITDTWETRERVVVAVTGGPESETLVRRAARIAARTGGGELLVVHVLRGDGLAGTPSGELGRIRRLVEDLGGSWHTVVGDDVRAALLEFARGMDATQLVLGTSRRSRFARLFDEGIGAAVVQDSGSIDVHMVSHTEAGRGLRLPALREALSPSRYALSWVLAVLLPAAASGVGLLGRDAFETSTDIALYFLAVVGVALAGGVFPALAASVISGVALNFFFTRPYYSLDINAGEDVIAVIAMVAVGVAVALVVDRAARLSAQAARARTEAALLGSYARTVLAGGDPVTRLLTKIRENFGLDHVALLERDDRDWQAIATAGEPLPGNAEPDIDLTVADGLRIVAHGAPLDAEALSVLQTAAGQAVLSLRQQRAAAQAAEALRRAETTQLRTALLSALGHDLRSPLTSIKAAVGGLRDPDITLPEDDRAELLATIEESTDRLTWVAENLLDSSRLATGAVSPQLRPVSYEEVLGRALWTVGGSGDVAVDLPENLPAVLADPGLLERAVANVVDNAVRYAAGSAVAIRGSTHAGQVELRVCDQGPGLPRGKADTIFAPFHRLGDRDTTTGIGLGLSVTKGFVEAMHGRVGAEDTPGGGTTIVISLPGVTDDWTVPQ